jgi:hypothetical protein
MPNEVDYTSTQASGPEQFQLHLLAKIRERLAQVQHLLITHTPDGDVAGLIDEAGAFFRTLAVTAPRPIIASATVSLLRPPLTPEPDDDDEGEDIGPLPRWIADRGNRHE